MILTRTLRAFVCRLLIGLVLFSQAAMVAYACSSPANAVSLEVAVVQGTVPGCDHLDPQTPNLCLEHCRAGQQSADTVRSVLVAATFPALLYSRPFALLPPHPVTATAGFNDTTLASHPVPHAVIHCVLRL